MVSKSAIRFDGKGGLHVVLYCGRVVQVSSLHESHRPRPQSSQHYHDKCRTRMETGLRPWALVETQASQAVDLFLSILPS